MRRKQRQVGSKPIGIDNGGRHVIFSGRFFKSIRRILMVKHCAAFVVAFSLVSLAKSAAAQETIPFVPSPPHVVQRMIELAEIKNGDILYDMGSGDGRIVIEAAKKYGIRGVGIDLNAELVEKARQSAKNEGVSHLVEFRAQDGLTVDISEATVVTL